MAPLFAAGSFYSQHRKAGRFIFAKTHPQVFAVAAASLFGGGLPASEPLAITRLRRHLPYFAKRAGLSASMTSSDKMETFPKHRAADAFDNAGAV